MKTLDTREVRLIMSKDKQWVAKGVTRDRHMIKVSDLHKDNKRFLTYRSEASARNGYKRSGFYGPVTSDDLEPVKATLTISVD